MVRCQEMSQITPTIALVAASTTATTYHGRSTAPALARPVETAAVLISYRSPEPPDTSPLPRHFSKIFFACSCASRSEEHTSELQSHSDLVCRLLLEKKKTTTSTTHTVKTSRRTRQLPYHRSKTVSC